MTSTDVPARVVVGQASLSGSIARYARAFDLLEVIGEPGRHPRRPGLLEWRRLVPEHFVFSVVIPAPLAALDAGSLTKDLTAHAAMVADALQATWWVLRTPPSVTPSARSVRGVAALIAELPGERRVAWEPRGVWSDESALEAARTMGVHLVRDLAREDALGDVDVVYTRLRALGEGARIGAAAAERVAERLMDATSACVVVEGTGAARVRQALRDVLGHPEGGEPLGAGEMDDEEDEAPEDEP